MARRARDGVQLTAARNGGGGQLRLFVAVPLPREAVTAITGLIDGLGPAGAARGIRWVQAEGLHLTIRFLGATLPDRIPAIGGALRTAAEGSNAFRALLAGAGAFPSQSRPRVLWIGLREGGAELTTLASSLDRVLEREGWPRPERPFRPHLTVARTDAASYDAASAAAEALVADAEPLAIPFTVDRLVLFRSHLGRGPARYEPLADAPLLG